MSDRLRPRRRHNPASVIAVQMVWPRSDFDGVHLVPVNRYREIAAALELVLR